MRFSGKTIIVTGGANGQGAVETRMLSAQGAVVVIADVDDEAGEALARELGGPAIYFHLDVSSEPGWTTLLDRVDTLNGGVHGLVNNAGICIARGIDETDLDLFQRHVAINQTGCFLGMKLIAPRIEKSGGGAIVNVGSTAGLKGVPSAFAYSASKWALRGMSKAAAMAYARRGIRVNYVCPGPIDTAMIAHRTPEQHAQRRSQVPLGRYGSAGEVAEMVLFLLSDASSYVVGAEISIDGGASI